MYKIEKGIPFPKYTRGLKKGTSLPLDEMEIGDSFVIDTPYDAKSLNRIRVMIYGIRKKKNINDRKFTVGKDRKSNKIRIWRKE